MEHLPVLGLILALALGLVSLALLARLPQRRAPAGITWVPVTLLLYNLWVAGFLATSYLHDHVVPPATPALTPSLAEVSVRLVLLALALAWLYDHVRQLLALVGTVPTRMARGARYTLAGLGVVLVAGWFVSARTGNWAIFQHVVALVAMAVFPAALVASLLFFLRSRRLEDAAWRTRHSGLALAYVSLFTCLSVLSIGWARLAAVSPGLPVALDVILELLYNVVAVVWVTRLTTWLGRTPAIPIAPAPDLAGLFAEKGITKREAEVIQLICLGKTNQEIGIVIAVVSGFVYVTYNIVSISFAYPHFLDDMAQARFARRQSLGVDQSQARSVLASLRAQTTLGTVVANNLRAFCGLGTVLSALAAVGFRKGVGGAEVR